MPETGVTASDPWSDWLGRGRWQGASRARQERTVGNLQRARDQVLAGARLAEGQTVLDVGAGTGLLALAARSKVGPSGRVVALDISKGALTECVRLARRARRATAPLVPVVGDATRLPLPSGTIDCVMTRSVLMHVNDKALAIAEMSRVLKPDGAVSLFEAIADVARRHKVREAEEIAATLPDYPRVREHALKGLGDSPQLGFDERDLVRWFRDAGFQRVRTTYTETHGSGGSHSRETVLRMLRVQPAPGAMSHEDAAREVLGSGATSYLESLIAWHLQHGVESHNGLLLLVASK